MCQTNLPRHWIRNSKFPLLQFFHFFHHLIWHMLCPSTVLPMFFRSECVECVLIPCAYGSAAFKGCTLPRTFCRCQLTRNSEDALFSDTESAFYWRYRFGDRRQSAGYVHCSLLGYRRFTRSLIVALGDMALVCHWIWHYVFRIASIMSSLPLPVPLPLSMAATFSVANHGKFMWLGL